MTSRPVAPVIPAAWTGFRRPGTRTYAGHTDGSSEAAIATYVRASLAEVAALAKHAAVWH